MRGFGSLYRQRGSRFWWMQYYRNGRRARESTGCERMKDAQEVLRAKLTALRVHVLGDGVSTPGDVAGLYAAIERDYAMNGRKSLSHLRSLWKNHLAEGFGAIAPEELTTDRIEQYIRTRQLDGAANASINRELAALKRMFKLAIKAQKLRTMPFIPMLEERNVRKGFVRDGQYRVLALETLRAGLWLRAMFELAFTYGWRRSELTGMRVSQIDFQENTIELNPGETKNDEGRLVTMTSRVRELLEQCTAGKAPAALVFTRPDGSAIGNFRRIWIECCKAAGVPGLLFHDLRRTGVRNMRRRGIPERVAMTISGHRTRSVFERYNIVDPSDVRHAVEALEKGAAQRDEADLEA